MSEIKIADKPLLDMIFERKVADILAGWTRCRQSAMEKGLN